MISADDLASIETAGGAGASEASRGRPSMLPQGAS